MKTYQAYTNLIIVLLCLSLVGCSPAGAPIIEPGQVVPLQMGTTQYIFQQAISGAPGSTIWFRIYEGAAQIVYAAPTEQGVGFVVTQVVGTDNVQEATRLVSSVKSVMGGGQVVCGKTWAAFRDWLTASGFTAYTVSKVTGAWKTFTTSVSSFANRPMSFMPILALILMPDGTNFLPDYLVPQEVKQ